MDAEKVGYFQAKLREIRASLVGDVAKNSQSNKEEFAASEPDITDDAARNYDRDLLLNLGEQDREKLKMVEEALESLKNGTFGTCQQCEEPIPEKRMEVVPFAKYCVKCLEEIENG